MGLSNGERTDIIANVVNQLYKLPRFKVYTNINPLLDNVWSKYLSSNSNNLHWLFGGETSANLLGQNSLLKTAFKNVLDEYYVHNQEKVVDDNKSEVDKWLDNCFPTVETLLQDGSETSYVWRILKLCESYFYSANRYQDEFSSSLSELTNVICKLRGIVFDITSTNVVFAVAWMMNALIRKVFRPYTDEDTVNTIGSKLCLHFYLRAEGQDPKKIYPLFKKWQFKDGNTQERLRLLIELCGTKLSYIHQHKQILEICKEHNKKTNEQIEDLQQQSIPDDVIYDLQKQDLFDVPIDLIALEKQLSVICDKHKTEMQKKDDNHDLYCYLTEQSQSDFKE